MTPCFNMFEYDGEHKAKNRAELGLGKIVETTKVYYSLYNC